MCLIRCSFKELPVPTRRERDTHFHKAEVFAVLRTTEEGGREGGTVMGKRDASKVIICFALKGAGACPSR